MSMKVVEEQMPALLVSICAQLRHEGNARNALGGQAAGAIEALWRDNVMLSRFALETELRVRQTMDGSAALSRFSAFRKV